MHKRFLSAPIAVKFDEPPMLSKKPGCPDRFTWEGETFTIVEKMAEWHDYGRRGRMARNMRPSRIARAERTGSWGVGRDFYRVRTARGRIFELYFDRAPRDVDDRHGHWVLYVELVEETP